MSFGVLGTLSLDDDGIRRPPTAPKQRQLLAFLLMNSNQVTSVSQCIEELWGDRPPTTVVPTLYTYVMQLRKALGGTTARPAATRLLTRDRGYLFAVDPGELDLHVFQERVERARRALDDDNDELAADLFRDALAIWRGPALIDVHLGPQLRSRVAGLEESRLGILEQRIEADLRLGRHQVLLGELSMLVEAHPLHENLHAQLMLALYRSGRAAHALGVFQRLRRLLREELGMEPLPRLRRLHSAMLRADPALDVRASGQLRMSLDIMDRPVPRAGRRHSVRRPSRPRPHR